MLIFFAAMLADAFAMLPLLSMPVIAADAAADLFHFRYCAAVDSFSPLRFSMFYYDTPYLMLLPPS